MASDYKELGKRASENYREEGTPLNESIEKIAKEEDLNSHEVKRVVEKANNQTFLDMFKEAEDKTFDFELADPNEVVHMDKESEGEIEMPVDMSDYNSSPENEKQASRDFEKVSSALEVEEDDSNEVMDKLAEKFSDSASIRQLLTKLSHAEQKIEDQIFDLKINKEEYQDKMLKEASKAYKQGYNPDDILHIWKEATSDRDIQNDLEELIKSSESKYAEIREWFEHNQKSQPTKTAAVNEEHSLYKLAEDYEQWKSDYEAKQRELEIMKQAQNLVKQYEQKFGE